MIEAADVTGVRGRGKVETVGGEGVRLAVGASVLGDLAAGADMAEEEGVRMRCPSVVRLVELEGLDVTGVGREEIVSELLVDGVGLSDIVVELRVGEVEDGALR